MLKLIVKQICRKYIFGGKTSVADLEFLRDGPFDIQGGLGFFEKKIVCFHTGAKKYNVFSKVKKKFVLHSVNFFEDLSLGAIKVCN